VVRSVAFSPDSRVIVSGGDDGALWGWDLSDPKRPTPLNDVGVERDQPRIPQRLRGFDTGSGGVLGLAFSPRGRLLASAGIDNAVRLWTVAAPNHVTPIGSEMVGHTGSVNAAAFSSDGRRLASSGSDHTIRLWDVTAPEHAVAVGSGFTGQEMAIEALSFSRDSRTIASASDDHTVILTTLDVNDAIARVCSTTAGGLTPDRWQQFVPEREYEPTCP
jgi:WD40 repeat protein